MERLTFALDEYKTVALDEENAEFEGHAAVFGGTDLHGDRIAPGAFAKSIVEQRGKIEVFWGHPDPVFGSGEPIGISKSLTEDHKGLFLKTSIAKTTSRGHDAYEWLKFTKKMDYKAGLSIGFKTAEWEMDRDVRVIKEVNLYEASIVNFPANPRARVEEVKSALGFDRMSEVEVILRRAGFFDAKNIRDLEQVLRDVGLSGLDAKGVIADAKRLGFQATEAQRDVSGLIKSICREQIAMLAVKHLTTILGEKVNG